VVGLRMDESSVLNMGGLDFKARRTRKWNCVTPGKNRDTRILQLHMA
jgi:hypothetical protein